MIAFIMLFLTVMCIYNFSEIETLKARNRELTEKEHQLRLVVQKIIKYIAKIKMSEATTDDNDL